MSPDEKDNSKESETNTAASETTTEPEQSSAQPEKGSDTPEEGESKAEDQDQGAGTEQIVDAESKETVATDEGKTTEKGITKTKPGAIKAKAGQKPKFVTKGKRDEESFWVPKTKLGRMVKEGKITTMKDALATGLRIREPEIIDILLPDLDDEVLDVNMVQRMTDSGRRVRFAIMTVVGNQNGYVGLGSAKGKEVGPAIRRAIDNAKLNIIEIRRGCGSWECGCNGAHTIPFTVTGKSGSTKVIFRPAPRGVGLAVGDVAKHILRLSGIKDTWGFTRGETRTTINYAKAVFMALQNTAKLKTTDKQIKNLYIVSGAIETEPLITDDLEIEQPPENPESPEK